MGDVRADRAATGGPRYAVVVPVFNEELNVPELYRRLRHVLESRPETWSLIFVNDGSADGTLDVLEDLHRADSRVRILDLSRNFGHQSAMAAGIAAAVPDHEAMVLMDADLQDVPEAIPSLLEKLHEGHDVVCAIRSAREDPLLHRLAFWVFYRLLRHAANIPIPLDSGMFCAMTQRVAQVLSQFPERGKFIPGLRAYAGFRQTGIVVPRGSRFSGDPKVGVRKQFLLALNAIVSFSTVPLSIVSIFGLVVSVTAFLVAILGLITRYIFQVRLAGWPFGLSTILFMGGIQLLSIGVLGEYVTRIYEEVKQRPVYVVRRRVGFEAASPAGSPDDR